MKSPSLRTGEPMSAEAERLERAGRYVLGLMDALERERAERDLEMDAKFRAAVVGVAERMHLFDLGDKAAKQPRSWDTVAGAIAAMPHMRMPSDAIRERETLVGQEARAAAPRRSLPPASAVRYRLVLGAVLAAFVLGYLAGFFSA